MNAKNCCPSGVPAGRAAPARPTFPEESAPPRPRLAFRLGVVGHRPNRLQHADLPQLNAVLKELLGGVKAAVEAAWDGELYAERDGRRVVLRALSPLAEGADRLFARQALDLGYSLCCVMPFRQVEYEKDFAAGSAKALAADALPCFRGLLADARQGPGLVSYEMDGSRNDESAAYGAAGRVVLNQSDLLVVIWDGQRLGKRGGTEEIFDAAIARGVPVIWIDAQAPHAWQIVDAEHPLPTAERGVRATPSATSEAGAIQRAVASLLELPQPVAAPPETSVADRSKNEAREHLKAFFGERKPAYSLAMPWGIFQALVGDSRRPSVQLKVPGFERSVEDEWPRDRSTPIASVVDNLRRFYAWPDKLAVLYANRYRSAFLAAFLLAAGAVGMALLAAVAERKGHHHLEIACIAVELVAICTILLTVSLGRGRRWHERWLEYRVVAELVRHLRLVAPLGGARPLPHIPAHWATYGQPSATWMAWYVRAVERDLGLPAAVVDKDHLRTCLDQLIHVLAGQVSYHARNAERNGRLESRLHGCGVILLLLTLLACGLHFVADLPEWHRPLAVMAALAFCCGFFPALGAALAGIANQGEFLRIHKRSQAMRDQLKILLKDIEDAASNLEREPGSLSRPYSPLVSARASDAARLLVHEVLDWRVVFLDRPLTTPT
jgi:hypothetical protein